MSFFVDGIAEWHATSEDSWAASYKTKHALTIWPSSCAPWHLFKQLENLWAHKNLHTDVH